MFISRVEKILRNVSKLNLSIKRNAHFYDIPEYYVNAFHLANATMLDNINWYFYNAIEKSFGKIVDDLIKKPGALQPEQIDKELKHVLQTIEYCGHYLAVRFPFKRKNGTTDLIHGFCVHHGEMYPIHIGGIRLHEDLDKSTVRGLATLCTFRNALLDIPYGGGFAGIKINPKEYDSEELTRMIRSFTSQLAQKEFLGPKTCIIEPEVNCHAAIMATIAEEYSKNGINGRLCVSGMKEKDNFENIVNKHIFESIKYLLDPKLYNGNVEWEKDIGKNTTFIVQGFGKLGCQISELFLKSGAICIGVIEENSSYYDPDGLDLKALLEYKRKHGEIDNFGIKTKKLQIQEHVVDFFIVCSKHKAVNSFNSPTIGAKIILEATSGGLVPIAHKTLVGKGKLVIPDLFVNSISSLVTFLEHQRLRKKENFVLSSQKIAVGGIVTDNMNYNPKEVNGVISNRIRTAAESIIQTANEYKLNSDIKTAAYIIAIKKLIRKYE